MSESSEQCASKFPKTQCEAQYSMFSTTNSPKLENIQCNLKSSHEKLEPMNVAVWGRRSPISTWHAPVHKARSVEKWISLSLLRKYLTGLTEPWPELLSNTFVMNWNADCEPGLITQHQRLTSLMLLWLKGRKFLQPGCNILWKAFLEEWRLL